MVADFLDRFAVRDADIADVRRVNDQLAAVGQYRLELVHTFPAVQSSSYISGAQARIVWNGFSIVRV